MDRYVSIKTHVHAFAKYCQWSFLVSWKGKVNKSCFLMKKCFQNINCCVGPWLNEEDNS